MRDSNAGTPKEIPTMKRWIAAMVAAVAVFGLAGAGAQDKKVRLSIGTGGTGGVYYPLGGGLAALISKFIPGLEKFKDQRVPLRTLVVFYPNRMHVVTVEGTGINKFSDLKGKRVSTGAPVSGTEVMAMRLIEALGMDPNKDM